MLQAPVETPYPGLRSPSDPGPVSPPSILRPASATPSPASAASLRQTPELTSPDQNSNSVRDLENAMSKHLPKDKISDNTTASVSEAATSALLRQFYSGRTTLEAGDPASLRGGYSGLGPAQPLPLKPSLYLDSQYPPDPASGLYPAQPLPGAGLHSLYNRGQSWYPGS